MALLTTTDRWIGGSVGGGASQAASKPGSQPARQPASQAASQPASQPVSQPASKVSQPPGKAKHTHTQTNDKHKNIKILHTIWGEEGWGGVVAQTLIFFMCCVRFMFLLTVFMDLCAVNRFCCLFDAFLCFSVDFLCFFHWFVWFVVPLGCWEAWLGPAETNLRRVG